MKKILMSGGNGSFAKQLLKVNNKFDIIAPSKKEMDITKIEDIDFGVGYYKPDYFIHSGAFVRPMKLHNTNPEKSIKTNIIGTSNVVLTCIKHKIKLIYISTDYVYPGDNGNYKETDSLLPINKYAWSKLGGECAVRLYDNSLILRISMTNKPFPHKKALVDCYRSILFDEEASKITLNLLDEFGVINVGGESKSIYEFVKSYEPKIEKIYLNDIKDVDMPSNLTMNTKKMKDTLGK